MEYLPDSLVAALLGLGSGAVLGLSARLGGFCTMGAIESAAYGNDQRQVRMWGIVVGIAILGLYGLAAVGQIDISATTYHQVSWTPLGSIIGGLVFGYGMALAGNCGFGALTRLGGGDLRSLIILIMIAISGFVMLNGPLAALRVWVLPSQQAVGPQGVPQLAESWLGITPILTAGVIGIGAILWALAHEPFRKSATHVKWSVAAGLAIVSAFWGTSYLNDITFDEIGVQGHTFVAPLGRTLIFVMTSSGGGIGFPVGSVAGVLLGAWLGTIYQRRFKWEACEDPRELGRQVLGATLMGFGGVMALGCSIGQGVSAFATLAYSGPVTLAAIVIGAIFGLRQLIEGFHGS